MSQSTATDRVGSGAHLKKFSCLTCRQRKVKCDRHNPCTNCIKAKRQCSFIAPVRRKPTRRKAPKEGLHAKLLRYEEMLKSYGAKIEASDNDNNASDMETVSEPDVQMTEDSESWNKTRDNSLDETKTRLVTKNGSSRYFDTGLWSNLGDEFHHPEEDDPYESVDGTDVPASDLFVDSPDEHSLVLSTFSKVENLDSLHLPLQILPKMLEVYADRVDPMMKFLHLPTFWSALTKAVQDPHEMSKSLEALIFAFYLVTIISLEDNECHSLLGEHKQAMSSRYKLAARQALINAEFLKSSSLMTVQAYAIFLMAMRTDYRGDSLFLLSGIAVRLGRRMGLHRDGTLLGLSPFEAEIRARLWWHIVHIDSLTSDFSGIKPSMDLFLCDTKIPLNVEDEDLSPDMVNPPRERTGITSIVLCLLRSDVGHFLRKSKPQLSYDVRWDNLTSPSMTLADKDSLINEMEDIFERKYLRYIDPSHSLHYLSSFMCRSSVCKMKLFAHHPRQFAENGIKVPQRSRDIIFAYGTKMLEYGNLVLSDYRLRKFHWYLSLNYLWDTLFFVLIEIRHRKTGLEVDHAWQLIGEWFVNFPKLLEQATEALYAALSSWTLQVWDECAAARKVEGLPELPTPEYITAIRRCRRPLAESLLKHSGPTDPGKALGNPAGYGEFQFLGDDGNPIADFEPMDSYDFSNLLSYDLEPSEWMQWERLISGQGL